MREASGRGRTGSVCESTSGSRINAASSAAETHLKEAYLSEQERLLIRGGGGGLGGSSGGTQTPVRAGEVWGTLPFDAPLLFGNKICSNFDEI